LRAESAHPDDVAIDPDLSRHGIPGIDVVTDSFDRARLIAERVEERRHLGGEITRGGPPRTVDESGSG